jgi:hypothetical protein
VPGSPGKGLEQLDRVSRRIFDEGLTATVSINDLTSEVRTIGLKAIDE